MRFIESLQDGDTITDIYLCKYKSRAKTKGGKDYDNLELQDKTGVIDGKIWTPNSGGIEEYEVGSFVEVSGDILNYNGKMQINIRRLRIAREGEYKPEDYIPGSCFDYDDMFLRLKAFIQSLSNKYLKELALSYFDDEEFVTEFKKHSAAKSVHHNYIGGLLEHTLRVVEMSDFMARQYQFLNRDLMITGALFHDLGKMYELTNFPHVDYTDTGKLIGHIVYGTMLLNDRIKTIDGFPENLKNELLHCILAHHGELEYGSPKKPALAEAVAINLADASDAKIQILRELLENKEYKGDWTSYNKFFDSYMKKTRM